MSDTATATRTRVEIKPPTEYKVVMFNDDVTPMEFVVMVLQEIYEKAENEAFQLMQEIHNNDRAIVYVSSLEIVRQKVADTNKLSQQYGFPLKVIKEDA